MRSIITSFLFAGLIITLSLLNILISIRISDIDISAQLKEKVIKLSDIENDVILLDDKSKSEIDEYLDNYVLYLTARRGFPNTNTTSDVVKNLIDKVNKNSVSFDRVLKIRYIVSLISNNSLILLLTILSLVISIIIAVMSGSLYKIIKSLSLAVVLSTFIVYVFYITIMINPSIIGNSVLLKVILTSENLLNPKMETFYSFIALSIYFVITRIELKHK